jgi:hypothetical protein
MLQYIDTETTLASAYAPEPRRMNVGLWAGVAALAGVLTAGVVVLTISFFAHSKTQSSTPVGPKIESTAPLPVVALKTEPVIAPLTTDCEVPSASAPPTKPAPRSSPKAPPRSDVLDPTLLEQRY